jgi:hypothetical protein
MILSQLSARPRLGSFIGDTIARLDNFGTAVCPTVAKTVGAVYGVPVGAVGGVLPTLCKDSRYVDPAHWASVGLEGLFGTSSNSSSSSSITDAATLAELQAEHTRHMLFVFAGLAGAGVVGFLALRGRGAVAS